MSEMTKIRDVRGVLLKDGRDTREDFGPRHSAVMYDEGVQMENDSGVTLFGWEEIDQVFV